MSVSPQPALPVPHPRSPQVAAASIPTADSPSPAQLAGILSNTLAENDQLKRDLEKANQRAERAERRLAQRENGVDVSSDRVAELDAQVKELLAQRGELEARLARIQDDWIECDKHIQSAEVSAAAARASFSNIVAKRGGTLQDITRNGASPFPVRAHLQLRPDLFTSRPLEHAPLRHTTSLSRIVTTGDISRSPTRWKS